MPWFRMLTCGPFATNTYLIGSTDSLETLIIDAPPESYDTVNSALRAGDRKASVLLLTHPHFDHILDTGHWNRDGIPVWAHAEASPRVEKPELFGMVWEGVESAPKGEVTRTLTDGEEISAGGLPIKIITVPGHDPASIAVVIREKGIVFVGDLIFRGGVGRTDLPGGDFDILAESIQNRIYVMEEETVLYPGHGPETTVGHEKRSNPFVRG